MKTIWKFPLKFPLETDFAQTISMPMKGSILHAGFDGNHDLCLWAAVDPSEPVMDVEIIIVGTGHPLPHVGDYIGTAEDKHLIWHVFTGPGHSANKTVSFHYQTKDN